MQHHLPPPILPPHIPPDGQQPVRIGARLRVRDRAGSFWFSARLLDRTEGAWLVGEPEREYREWIPLEDTEERVEIDDSIEPKQVSEDIRSQENFALFAERLQQSLPCSKYQRFHLSAPTPPNESTSSLPNSHSDGLPVDSEEECEDI
eukprot:192971_1